MIDMASTAIWAPVIATAASCGECRGGVSVAPRDRQAARQRCAWVREGWEPARGGWADCEATLPFEASGFCTLTSPCRVSEPVRWERAGRPASPLCAGRPAPGTTTWQAEVCAELHM